MYQTMNNNVQLFEVPEIGQTNLFNLNQFNFGQNPSSLTGLQQYQFNSFLTPKIEAQPEIQWYVQPNTEQKIKIEESDSEDESPSSEEITPQIRQLIKSTTYIPTQNQTAVKQTKKRGRKPQFLPQQTLVKQEFESNSSTELPQYQMYEYNMFQQQQNFGVQQLNQQQPQKIQRKKIGKSYQDTKNIPKNFGKAIMKYIKEHQNEAMKLLGDEDYYAFYRRILAKKDKIISIKEFKTLFQEDLSEQEIANSGLDRETLIKYNKVYRVLAYKFLRKEFQSYLLTNKKIKHNDVMNKYKAVLLNGLQNPAEFKSWK